MKPHTDTRNILLQTALDLTWEHSYGSVSVDDICKRAGVQKGSFYHFFTSKSELAVAAFESYWQLQRRPQLDRDFSAQVPPLERFARYCDQIFENQKERLRRTGTVSGCPFSSVGSEMSTKDDRVRAKAQDISKRVRLYLESALHDAQREGLWRGEDIPGKALELYSLVTGILLQARINNDLNIVKSLKPAILCMLSAQTSIAA